MITKGKFFALIAVISFLLTSSVNAGVLNGIAGAYDDGSMVWTGSTTYDNSIFVAPNPATLFGTIDYAVMKAADFSAAFPNAGVPAVAGDDTYAAGDALVYLYQINNDGIFAVSAEIVGVNSSANTIGQFKNAAGEVFSSLYGFDTGDKAIWNFASPQILGSESSVILAYSSSNKPVFGSSITVDGGTFGVSSVPTPGDTAIPEPTGLALVVAGALALASRRLR